MNEIEEVVNIGVIENFMKELPDKALGLGIRVILAILVLIVGGWIIKLIRKTIKKAMKKADADTGAIQFTDSFIKVLLYMVLVFGIAIQFGLDATSLVAILGSAGVAIGLAVQGSLSNFVGGVLILMLKPFKVGDYIIEDSNKNEGTVSEIQLFYTKLVTMDNKVVVLPNGVLANSSLTNVTSMEYRRVDVFVDISYQADIKKTKEVLLEVLKTDEATRKDQEMVVYVDSLGDSGVKIGVRCWFDNAEYWQGKWRITEAVKLALDAAEISIPYPQLDVHYVKG